MSQEPKLIEVPGIPGKLREQTLDEFLSVLTPDHLARQQLNEIRNQALRSVELSTQLMQANDKILELQGKLMAPTTAPELHAPPNKYVPAPDILSLLHPTVPELKPEHHKAPCPNCGELVSTRPAQWGIHQARKHPENRAPRPT